MSKNINSTLPLVRLDFNRAVDRRREPRGEPVYELYFRDISKGDKARAWLSDKLRDRN